MASTSSSPKTRPRPRGAGEERAPKDALFALLVDSDEQSEPFVLRLKQEWDAGQIIANPVLVDRREYRFSLIATHGIGGAVATVTFPGLAPESFALDGAGTPWEACGLPWRRYELPTQCEGGKPFRLAYGMASVDVELAFGDGRRTRLRTPPVACSCTIPELRDHVTGMLRALRSTRAAGAVELMSSPELDGETRAERGEPSESFLALAEKTIAAVEHALPALKSRPFARTRQSEAVVRASRARRAGRHEAAWLARNPSSLAKGRAGEWVVSNVSTMRPQTVCDIEENAAVASLAGDVARQASAFARSVGGIARDIEGDISRLPALAAGDGHIPAQLILSEQAALARRRQAAAEGVAARARRCARELERAWGTKTPPRFALPRRSKPFQEINLYAKLYSAMVEWDGRRTVDTAREAALLCADSMPRLYELFCLEEMLSYLLSKGFSAAETRRIRYTLRNEHFQNEHVVANYYRLARGGETVEVWFQPVIYGDARDESGLGLHRSTAAGGNPDSFWTPDFAVRASSEGSPTRIVAADSKWAPASHSRRLLERCREKYAHCVAGADGARVDAVVLLCGRGAAEDGWEERLSSWAHETGLVPHAACALTPFAGSPECVFGRILGGCEKGFDVGGGAAPETAAPASVAGGPAERARDEAPRPTSRRTPAGLGAGTPGERPGKAEIDPDVERAILWLIDDPYGLYIALSSEESRRHLRLEYPLCIKRKPRGGDKKRYSSEPYEVNGETVYLYKRWRPHQLVQLSQAFSMIRAPLGAPEEADKAGFHEIRANLLSKIKR